MENELFSLAVLASLRIPPKDVIGTKSEHRLHGALKYYFQPDDRFHEVRVERYVCDAVSEDGETVTEIQSRAFYRLKPKLEVLLKNKKVNIVYPIITEKHIYTVYAESGETSKRKSPKRGNLYDIFKEMYSLREFFGNENLTFTAAQLHCDEIRTYKGTKSQYRPGRKPIKVERIPTELISLTNITDALSLIRFIPAGLDERFDSALFAKAAGLNREAVGYTLNTLKAYGSVNLIGKEGRKNIFEIAPQYRVRSHP